MIASLVLAVASAPPPVPASDAPWWAAGRAEPVAGTGDGPAGDDADDAIERGLDWLAERQGSDGSWDGDPAATAVATLAFLARRPADPAVARALPRLAAAVAAVDDPRDGAVIATALVEAAAHGADEVRDAAARALARFEAVEARDLSSPAFAWLALALTLGREADLEGGPMLADVRAELIRRCKDGGAVERRRGEPGDRFRGVGAILLARRLSGLHAGGVTRDQSERLTKRSALPEWPGRGKEADLESWAWGAAALAAGESRATYLAAVREALLEGQATDGGWPDVSEDDAGRAASTAFAVLALAGPARYVTPPWTLPRGEVGGNFAMAVTRDGLSFRGTGGSGAEIPLERALEWIAGRQDDDGAWAGDLGATAAAALALLGGGNTIEYGRHAREVEAAVRWLAEGPYAPDGDLAPYSVVERSWATAALAEAAFFSPERRETVAGALERAVADLAAEGHGRDEHDAASLALAVSTLRGARVEYPKDWRDALAARLTPGALPDGGAPAYFGRLFLTGEREEAWEAALASLRPGESTPPLDLLFGANACFQAGGETWERWNERCKPIAIGRVGADGTPDPREGPANERIRRAALTALTLEVYVRYARVSR